MTRSSTVRALWVLLALLPLSAAVGWWVGRRWFAAEELERLPQSEAEAPIFSALGSQRRAVVPRETPREFESAAGDLLRAELAELNRRAIAALDIEDYGTAIELFTRCLEGAPEESIFSHNLAEALVRTALADYELMRPCPGCIELVERAALLAPERTEIARLIERWKQEAQLEEGFWRESSLHFDLAYDGARDEILWGSSRLFAVLEEHYLDLVDAFGVSPVDAGRPRIQVVVYRRQGFQELTGLGDWAGGAFDGSVRLPVEDFAREEQHLKRVLRHELAHAFIREVGGTRVPGWLNEGLAQWLEEERSLQVREARERIAGQPLFEFELLQGSLATWKDPAEITRAYAQSLASVDTIARLYGERVLFEMVAACKGSEMPERSFERLTRVPLATLLEDLAEGL